MVDTPASPWCVDPLYYTSPLIFREFSGSHQKIYSQLVFVHMVAIQNGWVKIALKFIQFFVILWGYNKPTQYGHIGWPTILDTPPHVLTTLANYFPKLRRISTGNLGTKTNMNKRHDPVSFCDSIELKLGVKWWWLENPLIRPAVSWGCGIEGVPLDFP